MAQLLACLRSKKEEIREEFVIPQVTFRPDQLQHFINELKEKGKWVVKHGRHGKPKRRCFTLDIKEQRLTYHPTHKEVSKATTRLKDVRQIVTGHQTKIFDRTGTPDTENYSFSLIDIRGKTLDLQVDSAEDVMNWVQCLSFLIRRLSTLDDEDPSRVRILQLWVQADQDGGKSLNFDELCQLLESLHVNIDMKTLRSRFDKVDIDRSGELNFTEFSQFYRDLTFRSELKSLFERYTKKHPKEYLTPMELTTFVHSEQYCQRDWNNVNSRAAIRALRPTNEKLIDGADRRQALKMSMYDFSRWLTEPGSNDWWNPKDLELSQDMNQPIHHYFISTSNNTFLSGDQLQSRCLPEMFRTVLAKGCRCVELILWDGPDGVPQVRHGYNRSPPAELHDCLMAINDNAFTTSPYPVIVSLEVHCNLEQQARMVVMITEIFDTALATPVAYTDVPPEAVTPEAYKYKILIRCRMVPPRAVTKMPPHIPNATSPNLRSALRTNSVYSLATDHSNDRTDHTTPRAVFNENDDTDDEKDHSEMPEEVQESWRAERQKRADPANRIAIARDLSEIVFFRSVRYQAQRPMARQWEVASLSEEQIQKRAATATLSASFAQETKETMFRVYPKGKRYDSSNLPCHYPFALGVQCVGMNWQTMDWSMRIYQAWFKQNGGCGYVLKPLQLRSLEWGHMNYSKKYNLRVKIISATQLPAPPRQRKGDVIDPFVEIHVTGAPVDCTVKPKATTVVDNNGFNPRWDEEFAFPIECASLAVLTLSILDKDTCRTEELAQASIPVECLRTGYRAVSLFSPDTNEVLPYSSLLCWFKLEKRSVDEEEYD